MRKFLKKVGITSQQKIEEAVKSEIQREKVLNNNINAKKTPAIINIIAGFCHISLSMIFFVKSKFVFSYT